MSLRIAAEAAVTGLKEAGLGSLICAAGSVLYNERISSYWSLTAQKKPYAILHPKFTEDVVKIVKTVVAIPDLMFAVRSGGHIAWGASNIDDGILIDLGLYMDSVIVNDEKTIVSLGPGGIWCDVYNKIQHTGITVAGGRSGHVGVAGLLTGGGISFYIPRIGFCCDQIVNMEIVLANGQVINANKDEHSDLWKSLKGGSAGNFGIITRFDVKAIPFEGLWAGMCLSAVTEENTTAHISAIKKFTDDSEQFPDSSYIVLWNYEPENFKDIIILSFLANTKGIENPPELKQVTDIPTIVKDIKHTTPYEFALSMDQPAGYHNYWQTTTFLNDERVMAEAVEIHAAAVEKIKAVSKTGKFSTLCLFQAMPTFYHKHSEARGGNVLGLNEHQKGRNSISMLLSINVSEPELVEYGLEVSKQYLKDVDDYAKSIDACIPWMYLNYADKDQNPLAHLLEPEKLKSVALKYDPEGVFQKRTPGFKVSKV